MNPIKYQLYRKRAWCPWSLFKPQLIIFSKLARESKLSYRKTKSARDRERPIDVLIAPLLGQPGHMPYCMNERVNEWKSGQECGTNHHHVNGPSRSNLLCSYACVGAGRATRDRWSIVSSLSSIYNPPCNTPLARVDEKVRRLRCLVMSFRRFFGGTRL